MCAVRESPAFLLDQFQQCIIPPPTKCQCSMNGQCTYFQHWTVFNKVSELFILVPPLLGLKGNLGMTLASRLSTQVNIIGMCTYFVLSHTLIYCLYIYHLEILGKMVIHRRTSFRVPAEKLLGW